MPASSFQTIVNAGLTNYPIGDVFARSGIFSAQRFRGAVGRPVYRGATRLISFEPYQVTQVSGEQLDQSDAELFHELFRLWALSTGGELDQQPFAMKFSQLLLTMGRAKGGHSILLARDSLSRLSNATYWVTVPGVFAGELGLLKIDSSEMERGSRGFHVHMDMRLATLFAGDSWSFISKTHFQSLADDPIARWLLAYYSTHREPFHVLASTLQPMLGREASQQSKYLQALRASVANLKRITKWPVCEVSTRDDSEPRVIVDKGLAKRSKGDPFDDDI